MSVLDTARKVYAELLRQRGEKSEPGGCAISAISAISPPKDENGAASEALGRCAVSAISAIRVAPQQSATPPATSAPDRTPAVSPAQVPTEPLSFVVVNYPAYPMSTVASAIEASMLVGLRTETTGPDPRRDRVRLLSLATDTGTYVIDCFKVDPTPLFPVLAQKHLIIHKAFADLSFLRRLGFVPGVVHDTSLLSRLLHGTRGPETFHDLHVCVHRELSHVLDRPEKQFDWSGTLSRATLYHAAHRVAVLRSLFQILDRKINEADLSRAAKIEQDCLPAMIWLANSGVAFNTVAWNTRVLGAGSEANSLLVRVHEEACACFGGPPATGTWPWNSQPGGDKSTTTSDDSLTNLPPQLAALVQRSRSAMARVSMYGYEWPKHLHAGRIYAKWDQLGADSGRMTCSEPNLQSVPRDKGYRRGFAAPPGRILVKADYAQIELRIYAKLANDEAMLAAFRAGVDLHGLTARNVLGISEVTAEQRQLAKALNFGLLFGMGAASFQEYANSRYDLDLTVEQASRYRDAFFASYPRVKHWHRSIPNHSVETRTLAGRRRLDVQDFTQKLNTPIQGSGADGVKQALALLWQRRGDVPRAFPVLVIHDEIVIECDETQAEAVAKWLKAAMIDGMAPLIDPVPVEVEVSVARTWGGE